jgi:hypothetical protein
VQDHCGIEVQVSFALVKIFHSDRKTR